MDTHQDGDRTIQLPNQPEQLIFQSNDGESPPSSQTYMFTEEQITKQLVDMKEQTEFMKKFRGALGIALHEIKTLRTTLSVGNARGAESEEANTNACTIVCNAGGDHKVTFVPQTKSQSTPTSAEDSTYTMCEDRPAAEADSTKLPEAKRCICSQFDNVDMRLLQEVLAKMSLSGGKNTIDTETNTITDTSITMQSTKPCNGSKIEIEKMQQVSKSFSNCIRRVDGLKTVVADRNTTVIRLCKELTQSRLIRVKREAKLEQKLNEVKEWKEKYETAKKLNEKQVKITRGLRVALNAERQRVKSSEKMQSSLDETRAAFESLKSQAGKLMLTLNEKNSEIFDLNAKLDEIQRKDGAYLHIQQQQQQQSSQIDHTVVGNLGHSEKGIPQFGTTSAQTDDLACNTCTELREELEALKKNGSAERPHQDQFQAWRLIHNTRDHPGNEQPDNEDPTGRPSHNPYRVIYGAPRGHPYGQGRTRVYAPYTSPESYRRVSRPPLRRRLPYDTEPPLPSVGPTLGAHGHIRQDPQRPTATADSDTVLLSPIDETDETNNDVTQIRNQSTATTTTTKMYDDIEGGPPPCHPSTPVNDVPYVMQENLTNATIFYPPGNQAISSFYYHDGSREPHEKSRSNDRDEFLQPLGRDISSADTQDSKAATENTVPVNVNNSTAAAASDQCPIHFRETETGEPQTPSCETPHMFRALRGSSASPTPHQLQQRTSPQYQAAEHMLSLEKQESRHPVPHISPSHGIRRHNVSNSPVKTGFNQFEQTKASYLEVGTSSTPSPSDSRNSSVDLHDDLPEDDYKHLSFNSMIRPNNVEGFELGRNGDDGRSHDGNTASKLFANDLHNTSLSPEPQDFGIVWHPALMKRQKVPSNDSLEDISSQSDQSSERSFGRAPRTRADAPPHHGDHHATSTPRVTSHRQKKFHRESSRYVMYKDHHIDVTKFSIHEFRNIVWTLEGGPDTADDFIKFLASLARKLNSSPKWAGRHAMGDPKDWLALRGLF